MAFGPSRYSCHLLWLLLVLDSGWTQDTFMSSFNHRVIGSKLDQIAVDPDTGDVFVAGRNVIVKLDKDLENSVSLETGPTLDSVTCDPANARMCSGRTLHDNDAQILEIDPDSGNLLFCGTVHQGLCSIIPKNDLSMLRNLTVANKVNYAGSRQTTYAFYGHPNADSQSTLYIGSTYDGRPLELSQPALSGRHIVQSGDSYQMEYVHENVTLNERSAISIHEHYIRDYRVKYIHGFEHNGYTYFLTLQRQNIDSTGFFEARLARVCQNDPGFYSYTELRLSCRKINGVTTFYNIPQAAFLSDVGNDVRVRIKASRNDKILYVLYGQSKDKDNDTADPSFGTGLCGYTMAGIEEEFVKAQRNCYMGKGSLLEWIRPNQGCQKDLKIATGIDSSFCGSNLNVGIDSRYSHSRNKETLITTDYLTTSLLINIYNGKTIAVMGTATGEVLKMLVSGRKQPPYAVIPVGYGLPHPAVATDMTFDLTQEHIYVLTGDVITKVPLLSCEVYTDCARCVLTRDPLNCGWCSGKCTQNQECTGNFSPDSCPPVLYQFEPKSGPLEGGTMLTIHGKYFGNATAPKNQTLATVTVAYQKCDIQFRNTSVIICKTGSAPNSTDREVQVYSMDMTNTTEQFVIRGLDSSRHVSFSYKEPIVRMFEPDVGPKSGGTKLTIHGQNLDIGSHRMVNVAGLPCEIIWVSSSRLVCSTSSWHHKMAALSHDSDQPIRAQRALEHSPVLNHGPVNVTIDAAKFRIPGLRFSYEDDPVIDNLEPKHSIMSGGFPINITGANLHIITNPQIEAMVLHSDGTKYYENCTVFQAGSWMICPSPNLTRTKVTPTAPDSPLKVDVSFVLDGVTPHSVTFDYYMDPVLSPFISGMEYFYVDDVFLKIHGHNIDLAATEDNIDVFLDDEKCNVTFIGTTIIICQPDRLEEDIKLQRLMVVRVKIGNHHYEIGQLQFSNRRTDFIVMTTMGPALGIAAIIILILILSWMKKTKRGPFRKKIPREQMVRYTRGSAEAGATREQMYRLPVENPYWSEAPQIQRNRMVMVPPIIIGSILDDESRRLIDDSRLMITRDRILLLEIIGQGHFGCVYRGFLKVGEEGKDEFEIAVKTVKSLAENMYSNSLDAKRFLDEALRMREFDHPHILRLIGIALDKEDLPLVVLPFMKHGDLLSYIRNDENSPTVKNLIDFGIQIAEGMAYLANLKFVHRDLAARNCMLDDNMNVKVADFGLSRDIYERDYYSSDDRKAKLPVKWMALESLEKGIYNTKTDVWAFGIVLWELMTRGVCPYPDVDNWDIIKYLKIGRRMPQPAYCPDSLYAIMLDCWDVDPKMRPPFCDLVHHIKSIIITMQQMQQKVSVTATYINVPSSQGYLYPQITNGSAMSTLV